jgi:DNA-binding MarR family transcriptional regulator
LEPTVAESPDLLSIASPPSSGDGLLLRLLLLTGRCHRHLAQRLVGLDDAPAAEWLLLACAAELGEACRQSDLVERLGCSPAHVSGVVERLRQRGWMTADRPVGDRRRQCWRVTPAGSSALAGLRFADQMCDRAEVASLAHLLERLDEALTMPEARRDSA